MTLTFTQVNDIDIIIKLLQKAQFEKSYGDAQKDLELAKRGLSFIEIDSKDFEN